MTDHTDMGAMEQALETFIAAVRESEIYKTYRAELEKVKQFPELKAQIDEFRKRNYQMQSQTDIDFDKLESFEREYEAFREQTLVSDFLAAELALCRMLQKFYMQVTDEIGFE